MATREARELMVRAVSGRVLTSGHPHSLSGVRLTVYARAARHSPLFRSLPCAARSMPWFDGCRPR
jgi:hypothetical protein